MSHEDVTLRVNGQTFLADGELAPLLVELNRVGFRTLYHCDGRGPTSDIDREGYLVLDADCFTGVEMTNDQYGRRLILRFPAIGETHDNSK